MNIMKSFNETNAIQIGKFIFTQLETIEWNNHKYSKSWHRQYGGVKEVSNRRIIIEKIDGRSKSGKKQMAVVTFDSWHGNVLLTAIKNSGLFPAPQTKAPLSVRLDKYYDAQIIRTAGKITVYNRTLLGEHVDYVVTLNSVTFHGASVREAIKGLHNKIKSAAKKINEPISYKLCKELGFCDSGIKSFCDAFGLSVKDTFSPAYLESIVKADFNKAAPYKNELLAMAKALNYSFSI
jgi:hypothetical protein